MPSLFEVEPNPHDPYDGIDLLSGLEDLSAGKVGRFFAELIDERGLGSFVAYSRLAQRILYPHYIIGYAEQLVIKVHALSPDRNSDAWVLVREELDHCLGYLDIWSERPLLPLPILLSKPEEGVLGWDMRYTGNHQLFAGICIPKVEAFKEFTLDQNALGDIHPLVAHYTSDKEDAFPQIV